MSEIYDTFIASLPSSHNEKDQLIELGGPAPLSKPSFAEEEPWTFYDAHRFCKRRNEKPMGDPRVKRFLELLASHSFVRERIIYTNGSPRKLFYFGILGAVLRKNIFKQWWDSIVLQQPNTFYVEYPPLEPLPEVLMPDKMNERLHVLQGTSLRSSLSQDCNSAYLTALELTNGQLPVSVASSGQCFRCSTEVAAATQNEKLLTNGLVETQLLLQHYSPPVSVGQVFDFWLRNRLRWWRQFSSNPAKFNSSTITCDNDQNSKESNGQAVINYNFPWGTETIETICNQGDRYLQEMEESTRVSCQARYQQKTFYPHLIECQTSVEQCMSVFLTDGYREQELKSKSSSRKQDISLALQLHPLLSPYQVAISVTGSRSREVRLLAEHVAKELREAGISVLRLPSNSSTMESQYKRNDEMGVPYTVVMSDQTLDSGIISIRNRDTHLKQQQHISKLQSLLAKNLSAKDSIS